jgi:hypothetical protein
MISNDGNTDVPTLEER